MVKKPEKNQKKNTNTTTRPWIAVVGILLGVLAIFVILMLLIPQKAILRTTMSAENSTKLSTGYYDFHVLGVDTFDDKKVLDQTFADVYVENGRYELKISLPKYLESTRVATTVCYSTQGSEKPNGFKGEIDGLEECDSNKLKNNSNIYDAKDCARILNVIHPNTLFGWLFGWREGIFEEGCARFGNSAFLSDAGDTDRQGLQLNGNELTISNGNTVILPIFGGVSGGSTTNSQNLTNNNVTNTTETTNNFLDCTDCLTTTANPWVAQADSGPNSDVFANSIVDFIGGDAVSTTNDGSRNITFDIIPGVGVDTTGDAINVRVAGPITINGSNEITLGPCGAGESLQYDGTNWICVSAAGTYSYILAGDLGASSVIDSGDTALISGGAGLISTGGGADNVTLDVNPGIAISTLGDAINVIEGNGIDTVGNQVNVTPGTAIDTIGDTVNVRFAGPIIVNGTNQITIQPCIGINDVLAWDGSNWVCSAGGGLYSWTLSGDSGANQIVNNTDVATIVGGNGVSTVVGATDNLTVDINPGIAIDLTGDAVNVRFAGPIALNGSNQLTLQPCAINEILRFDGTNWVCDPTTFTARDGLINVGTDEDPIVDARANNGLRVDPQAEDDSIQLGARFDDPGEKPEANLVFNTEIPQNNFSIAWTGTRLTNPNALFGIGTTPGATPDPNSTGLSNLNERLDVIGNIENIADNADPIELVTPQAGCTNPIVTNPSPNSIFVQGRYAYVFNNLTGAPPTTPRTLQVFDLQTPSCPRLLATINQPMASTSFAPIPTNTNTLGYVSSHFAYAVNDLGYVNMTDITSPTQIPFISTPQNTFRLYNPATYTGAPASNVATPRTIRTEGNYMYITLDDPDAGPQDNDYMLVYDVSQPNSPTLVSTYNLSPIPFNPSNQFNPRSMYIENRIAYIVGANAVINEIDISNPDNPRPMSPTAGGSSNQIVYGLAGMVGVQPTSIFVQDRYAYIGTTNGIFAYDVGTPTSPPTLVGTVGAGLPVSAVTVNGRYLYANTGAGTAQIDVRNPSAMALIGTLAGQGTTAGAINGRYMYGISSLGAGPPGQLTVMDTHGIETTALLAHAVEAGGLQVQTNAYVGNNLQVGGAATIGDSLQVQGDTSVGGDLTNLLTQRFSPQQISTTNGMLAPLTPDQTTDVDVVGNYMYTVGRNSSTNTSLLNVYDVTNDRSPRLLGNVSLDNSPGAAVYPRTGERPTAVRVKGKYAYVANSESNTLQVVDVSNVGASPTVVSSINTATGDATDKKSIAIQDKFLFLVSPPVGSGLGQIEVFDISNPYGLKRASTNSSTTLTGCVDPSSAVVHDRMLYITCPDALGNQGTISIYNTSFAQVGVASSGLQLVSNFTPGLATPLRRPVSVAVQDKNLYVVYSQDPTSTNDSQDYLAVIDASTPNAPVLRGFSRPLGLQNSGVSSNVYHGLNVAVTGRYATITGFRFPPGPESARFNELQIYDISQPSIPVNAPTQFDDSTILGISQFSYMGVVGTPVAGNVTRPVIVGKTIYSAAFSINAGSYNEIVTTDLNGTEIGAAVIHSLKTGGLAVAGTSNFDGEANINGGLSVGQNLQVNGNAGFSGRVDITGDRVNNLAGTGACSAGTRLAKEGSFLYQLRSGTNGVCVFSMGYSNQYFPSLQFLNQFTTTGITSAFDVQTDMVYVVSQNAGSGQLEVFNRVGTNFGVTTLANPNPTGIDVRGKYAYISYSNGTLDIYDIGNMGFGVPQPARRIGTVNLPGGNLTDVKVTNNLAIVTNSAGAGSVSSINITIPTFPSLFATAASATPGPNRIELGRDYFYVSSIVSQSVTSYFLTPNGNISVASNSTPGTGPVNGIRNVGNQIVTANGPGVGMRVFDVSNRNAMTPGTQSSLITNNFADLEVFGRNTVVLDTTLNALWFYDMGGAYVSQAEIGQLLSNGLTVSGGETSVDDLSVNEGLSVRGSTNLYGSVSVQQSLNVGQNFVSGVPGFTMNGGFQASFIGSDPLPGTIGNNDATVAISNTQIADTGGRAALRLNVGTVITGTQTRFVRFYAGCTADNVCTGAVGNIRLNNNAVAYTTAGADFAERVDVADATEAGDIVGIHAGGNRKAIAGDKLIGVVSDTAGFIGNDREGENENQAVVGMVGQVRTKVSTQNGAIVKGDLIAVSTTPGVGAKAVDSAEVVGKAMEDFSCADGQVCQGTIKVYVDPQLYDADILSQSDIDGLLAINADTGLGTQESEVLEAASDSEEGSQAVSQGSENSSPRLKDLLTSMQTQIGTQQTSIDSLNVAVSQLQAFINSGALAGDITLGGNVLVSGDLTLGGDNAGKSTVVAGQTSVRVNFASPKDTAPSVDLQYNPSSAENPELLQAYLNGELRMVVRDVSTTGFTIQINQAQLQDLKLNWTAIEQE